MRVAVFGASGVQGAAQVAALAVAGHEPVAISRNPVPLTVDGKQIETAAADFSDAEGIKKAISGSEVVFLNLPSTSFQKSGPVIAGAKLIGEITAKTPSVKLLIFNTSMPVPDETKHLEAQDHRREMRRLLRETGVPVISIQPVAYLDNLLEGWALPPIRDRDTVVYCHKPDLRVSWICHADLAQLMIAAMTRPHLAGRNFAVGGPETVVLAELTEKLSRAWNKPLKYENQTVADFCDKISQSMKVRSGLDVETVVDQMFRAYTWYNDAPEKPFVIDMKPILEELPCKLTTIEEWGRMRQPPPKAV